MFVTLDIPFFAIHTVPLQGLCSTPTS